MTITLLLVGVILIAGFAMRMSYEKFCLRSGIPFRSWLGKGR
jgi:hypothetical protein